MLKEYILLAEDIIYSMENTILDLKLCNVCTQNTES